MMRTNRWATLICALHAAATSAWYVVWRHAFAERSADEALFENLLWNAAHGHGLRTTIEGDVPHLAVHFSPVLFPLVPLYSFTGSMHIVHFLVSALTALAGFRFYLHVARSLDSRAALPALIAFLLTPTLVLQTFMEFHEQALAILPLTLLLIAISDGRQRAALWSALALLCVREDNSLLVAALGAVCLLDPLRRRTGWLLVAFGGVWLLAWRAIAVPWLSGGVLPEVFGNTYSTWGSDPEAVVVSVLSRPLEALRHILSPVPLKYLALLFAPALGLLPLGNVLVLATMPQMLMILLADHDARQFQIRMHYSVAPAIVLLFSTIATVRGWNDADAGLRRRVRRWAPIAMMTVVLALAPAWIWRAVGRLNPHASELRELLRALPDSASVTAPGYILNHLAARRHLGLGWYQQLPSTEYLVLEDSSRFFFRGSTVDAFYTSEFDSLLKSGGFHTVLELNGWRIYRRGETRPRALSPGDSSGASPAAW